MNGLPLMRGIFFCAPDHNFAIVFCLIWMELCSGFFHLDKKIHESKFLCLHKMVYSLSFLGVERVGKLMLEIHSFWDTVQISFVNLYC